MKRIASRDNPFYKSLRSLVTDPASRRSAGLAVVEGVHLVDACIAAGHALRQLVVGDAALVDAEAGALVARAAAMTSPPERIVVDDALYASLRDLGPGVPILAVVDRPSVPPPDRIVRSGVALDRIQDPGNVGSILRSAAVAGFEDVLLSGGCADAWSPKVLRAAMGAHFHLRLSEACDLAALRASSTVPWFATSPHATRSLYDTDLTGESVWAFGHEGRGLDPALLAASTGVAIPQPGRGESLNVAASAAVCFFRQVRQRSVRRGTDPAR